MLRIKTLGGWGATRADGQPHELPAQRVSLLALLCLAGERGISRDRTVALLWPDRPDENGRHSLGQLLYALRRDAESADVVLGTTIITLNPAVVSCDAWSFEAAVRSRDFARAATLYEGPFLSGVHLRGSAELQQLVDGEAVRLARVYADVAESLARDAAERGEIAGAIEWWRRLAAADPFSSRAALELVRALASSGDRVAALQSARVHETLVRAELEVEPDPSFVRYVEELRTAELSSGAPASRKGASSVSVDGSSAAVHTPPNAAPRSPLAWRNATTLTVGIAAAVALLVGATRYLRHGDELDARRVYIAAFENGTGDATLDPLGGMASDWVSQGLEQSGVVAVASNAHADRVDVRLRAPNASLASHVDPLRDATALGAGTVVSGTYYRIGDQLRFQVKVSDVAHGEVLDSFDASGGTVSDPTLAMEVVRQRTMGSLASIVDPRLSSWVRVASKPPTYQAYREFVTGQSYWGTNRRQALVHFQRAIALDSTFYAARVEAAILHRLLDECDATERIVAELSPVRDRLAPYEYHTLDGEIAQCHADWERSYRESRALADLRPGSAFLEYSLAIQAMQLGRYREARDLLSHHTLERGVAEVGPNFAVVYAQVLPVDGDRTKAFAATQWLRLRYPTFARAWGSELVLLARDGRVEAAERFVDTMTTLPLTPSSAITLGMRRAATVLAQRGESDAAQRLRVRALAFVTTRDAEKGDSREAEQAQILYELGRLDEARSLLLRLIQSDSADVDLRGYLGLVAARCGEEDTAREADAWLASQALGVGRTRYPLTPTTYRARIAAELGEADRALALLRVALDENSRFMLPAIAEYEEFAPLRRDERFRRLVALQ